MALVVLLPHIVEPIDKLLKYQISNQNDLYLFPPLHYSSQLAITGLHVSFHTSGVSHLRMRVPIKCMRVGPQITLPFSKTQLLQDIAVKKQSLFTPMDISNQTNGGYIAISKNESMLKNFLSSPYMTNLRENRKFIDYYNLVLTNLYRPTADFKEFYPYKTLEIDMNMVERSTKTYEAENLYRSNHSQAYCDGYHQGYRDATSNKLNTGFQQGESSQVNIRGNNNHVNINQAQNARSSDRSDGSSS